MPRSASDGGGGSSRLRNVFARSPLAVAFSTVDDSAPAAPVADPAAAKEHSPREPSPKEPSPKDQNPKQLSASWFYRASEQRRSTPEFDMDGFKFPLWKRQRSKSNLGGNRPLSLSKLPLHLSVETDVLSPADAKEASDCTTLAFEESVGKVLHHGEVQIAQTGWRKKFEYMVLTEHQLFRFKNSRKASERFPWILSPGAQMRRPDSTGSASSLCDPEPSSGAESPTDLMAATRRPAAGMPLSTVIAVQLVAESRARVGVELVRQEQGFAHAASLTVWVERPSGQQHWLEGLGGVVRGLPPNKRAAFPPDLLALVQAAVGADMDGHSGLFLVHPRQSGLGDPSHSPMDELKEEKKPSGLVILVTGKHKVHIVTAPKSHRGSTRSLHEISKLQSTSHGIVSLTCISVRDRDDSFDLFFRYVSQPTSTRLWLTAADNRRSLSYRSSWLLSTLTI
jgi:hypothetical protein